MPVALGACRRAKSAPLPDGQIVFASDALGHKLRDGFRPPVPDDAWEEAPVVIVGGGVAGLAAAWRFERARVRDYVLLELDPAPGGTAKSGASSVSAYPWGAHYVTAPMKENTLMALLLREVGVVVGEDAEGEPIIAEEQLCRDPEERLYFHGRWHEGLWPRAGASADDLAQYTRFRAEIDRFVAMRDARGRRAFAIPVAACSEDPELAALDRVSMEEWMRERGFTSARLRWLVEYACRDDYGATLGRTSAWAGIFYYASRLRTPGAEAQPIVTWPEGNGRLVAHLFDSARARVRLGVAATEIVPEEGGVRVAACAEGGARVFGFRAERVIFAAPHFLARHLLRPWRDHPPPHLSELEYGAWMVANLTLSDRPASRSGEPQGTPGGRVAGFPLAWDNVLYDSPSLGYVVATHQKARDRGPTVFTYYYPLTDSDPHAARRRLYEAGWGEWAEIALADLSVPHPDIRALTTRLDVVRWGHAMIRPRPGFIFGRARAEARRPYRNVHFAHSDLSGIPIFEEALYQGVRAAEEVLGARGVPFEAMT
jgi:glycine/D-amino acid oxidase-like deaminating enzyme